MDMAKADHHRVVIKQALKSNQIPNGLTVDIHPYIYKADQLVTAEWAEAPNGFSRTLCDILVKHYTKVVAQEQALQQQLQNTMNQTIQRSKLTSQDHQYILRLWTEETAVAVAEATKYADEKAEQRKTSSNSSRKRVRDEAPVAQHDSPKT